MTFERPITFGIIMTLVAFLLPAPRALGTTGTMSIGADTTLTEDHFGTIMINDDDVTLDCGGHTVQGSGFGIGINATGRTGITIRGCTVTTFEHGILLVSTTDSTLANNVSLNNRADGIRLNASSTNTLTANTSLHNGRHGFALSTSHNNRVADNAATTNGATGFTLESSNFNSLRANRADNNVFDGFQLNSQSAGNELLRNLSRHNEAGHGFGLILGANGNTLERNIAHHNAGSGFLLSDADGNDLYANRSLQNQNGLLLDDADGSSITQNFAHHNTEFGFMVANTSTENTLAANHGCHNEMDAADHSSGANTWVDNRFCTFAGI